MKISNFPREFHNFTCLLSILCTSPSRLSTPSDFITDILWIRFFSGLFSLTSDVSFFFMPDDIVSDPWEKCIRQRKALFEHFIVRVVSCTILL